MSTDGVTAGVATDVDEDLQAAIEAHESVNWRAVPGISVSEAATWTSRLVEAREEIEMVEG